MNVWRNVKHRFCPVHFSILLSRLTWIPLLPIALLALFVYLFHDITIGDIGTAQAFCTPDAFPVSQQTTSKKLKALDYPVTNHQHAKPFLIHHIHPFNDTFSGTTQVSRYQKGKTNLDFTETRDSECQWHQLGHMQVCTSLQTDNHTSTPSLSFLQAGCRSCRPTNSIKALIHHTHTHTPVQWPFFRDYPGEPVPER